jgi:hypothetical protein
MKLDRTKTFGVVCGRAGNGAKFTQHGLDFDLNDDCISKVAKDITAAKALIKNENAPPPAPPGPEPKPAIQAVRYAHSGNGKYDVYGTDGYLLADNITEDEAKKMVPTQVGGVNLAFLPLQELRSMLKNLGGKVVRKDTADSIIKKIKGNQTT